MELKEIAHSDSEVNAKWKVICKNVSDYYYETIVVK
jgi:hypothetical protein